MSIFSGWMQWVHHVYESTGAADAFRAVMTNADGKIDNSLLGESGTWTPNLLFGGANVGIGYASRNGEWWRFGNLMFVSFDIRLTAVGSSTGNATVTALPVTTGGNGGVGQLRWVNLATSLVSAHIFVSGTSVTLSGMTAAAATATAMTHAAFANNSIIIGSCFYKVA